MRFEVWLRLRSWPAHLQTLTVETLFLAALPLTDHQNEPERRTSYEALAAKDLCDRPDPVASNRILGIAMELSKTTSFFPHVSRFIRITFAAAMPLPSSLASRTAKELIGDACLRSRVRVFLTFFAPSEVRKTLTLQISHVPDLNSPAKAGEGFGAMSANGRNLPLP